MSRAVWTDTADYMILRCAACGMPHIVHRQMMGMDYHAETVERDR